MIEILTTHDLPASCETALEDRFTVHRLHLVEDREGWLAEHGARIRAVASHHVPGELIAALPNLELIASIAVGTDSIDLDAAKARGIPVTNTAGALDDAVAEFAIGMMIALARRIPQADRFVREGRWGGETIGLFSELNGRTLGILGLGRIGHEIARRALAMKMRVVYHGRRHQPNQPYTYYDDLEEMAREVDWLVVIAPGGPETRGIVSRNVLEALGPNGMLVNIARGSLVDEAALVEMLQAGGLGGAALDVFADEPNVPEALFSLDNVVLSPHQGSATGQTRDAMGRLMIANLDAHFGGRPLPTRVV